MGRTALNKIVTLPGFPDISEHPLIKRFIKGVFNTKPAKPRYTYTWDINKVLSYIANLGCNETLSDKILSQKLVILLLLVNGLRINTIMSLSIQHMEADENSYTFIPIELQKHSRPSRRDIPIRFVAYKINVNLCPVSTLKEYLKRRERTSTINITQKIFVRHRKPIREAHKETLSRWVKEVMKNAGIDVNIFKPHSCRSASSSAAKEAGVPIEETLKQRHGQIVELFKYIITGTQKTLICNTQREFYQNNF